MVIANTQSTKEALDRIPLEPGSPGVLSRTFRAVIPFYHDPRARAKAAIVAQYHKHLHHVQDEIDILLIEANTILGFLYALENHLDSIYKFASEDNAQVQLSRDEILGHLWTLTGIWNTITGASSTAVGGWRLSNLIGRGSGSREGGSSRSKLSDYDRQIGLLRHVTENRKSVWAHVTGVIMKLKTMHAGLENLHERTNATKYRRDGTDIPLSVHLGYVQRGAERLEAERKRSKKMEDDVVKKILDLAHGR
ncbi:hypothetical protein L228DRAFT_146078 [Xylona heveae TC161]|uniref:Uncharacterized protein n=1 Tax=Xylona heveae (strain CBS 132557 / TC161) TaxID=1328760 RepID=A0A165GE88_XYLHT|nr:hypothetical protein L228DRAFT_146078 [Xylona heveae TC161]KZF22086.1 hypothetical protein L228DRAFT_146078 [Xylona heveae TC161]